MISLSEIILNEGLSWKNRVDKYYNQEGIYVHFSDLPKLGINPKSKYKTPIGIYSYPFKQSKISNFAIDRKYMIIFKAKNPDKVLDSSNYNQQEFNEDYVKLANKYGHKELFDLRSAAKNQARNGSPAGRLWYITWKLSDENIVKWNKIWREVLDYDGFSDENSCSGIIHKSEPCQVVFWSMSGIEVLDIIEKDEIEFRSEYENSENKEYQQEKKEIQRAVFSLGFLKQKLKSFEYENERVKFIRDLFEQKNIKKEILEFLSQDKDEYVRTWVAENINTPVHILEKLSEDENSIVRAGVVYNSNVSANILEKLSNDNHENIRRGVAVNQNSPVFTLEKLSGDKSYFVRTGVVLNPITPVSILEKLSNDVTEDIRYLIAKNPRTPISVLEKLSKDKSPSIRLVVLMINPTYKKNKIT